MWTLYFHLVILLFFITSAHSFSISMSATDRPFAINVKFHVKPERRDEFLKTIQSNLHQTMTEEPNALQFVLGQDSENPDIFYLHEEYKTRQDHADTHTKTTYYDECMKFFASDPFVEPHQADEFLLAHDLPTDKIVRTVSSEDEPIVCLNVELCILPELRQEFLDVIRNNKRGSDDDEPLCLQYSYGESVSTPNVFHFHEEYLGWNGLKGHQTAPHFAVWEEFASKSPFTKPPVVQTFTLLK